MQKLLMLHGALGVKEQFDPLRGLLNYDFATHAINFSGHGGRLISSPDFSISFFAKDVLSWMDINKIDTIDIFGYSMGGYVALCIVSQYPARIGRIFTLATKFDWNKESSAKEVRMLDPEKIKEKVPSFAQELINRHGVKNWESVLNKTANMMLSLGKNPVLTADELRKIENKTLLSVGDKDIMVTVEETAEARKNLKNAELLVLENTHHPLEGIDTEILKFEISNFFMEKD